MKNVLKNKDSVTAPQPHYGTLDGLRTIAVVGIVMMHVLTNMPLNFGNYLALHIIPDFTNFTFLFMILSAFSMCCGYYTKVKEGQINLDRFYKRRFSRILPFFALMVLLDFVKDHNVESL